MTPIEIKKICITKYAFELTKEDAIALKNVLGKEMCLGNLYTALCEEVD